MLGCERGCVCVFVYMHFCLAAYLPVYLSECVSVRESSFSIIPKRPWISSPQTKAQQDIMLLDLLLQIRFDWHYLPVFPVQLLPLNPLAT